MSNRLTGNNFRKNEKMINMAAKSHRDDLKRFPSVRLITSDQNCKFTHNPCPIHSFVYIYVLFSRKGKRKKEKRKEGHGKESHQTATSLLSKDKEKMEIYRRVPEQTNKQRTLREP